MAVTLNPRAGMLRTTITVILHGERYGHGAPSATGETCGAQSRVPDTYIPFRC